MGKKGIWIGISIILILAVLYGCFVLVSRYWWSTNEVRRFFIPDTYRGWVVIHYNDPSCSPLPSRQLNTTLTIDAQGQLCTSSPPSNGGYQHFYLVDAAGQARELNDTTGSKPELPDQFKQIWYFETARSQTTGRVIQRFFVGTGEEARKRSPRPEP